MQVNIQVSVHRDADRRHIARTMPGKAYAKGLTQMRQLQRRCDPTDLRDVATYKVDTTIHNQIVPFSRIIK
ncbi:hypothetical protein D3C80_1949260 [compost metagenome]